MTRYTLTILDTTGVQSYIFGSNRLRENIGASQLVESATHEWVQQSLDELRFAHNLRPDGQIDRAQQITQPNAAIRAELILRGGGNVVLLFRSLDDAKALVRLLSRRLLAQAAGLEITAAHQEFDFDGSDAQPIGGLDGVYRQVIKRLSQAKQQRRASAPLLGQGVTLECRSTGLPAIGFDAARQPGEPAYPVSADVRAKLNETARTTARQRFKAMLPPDAQQHYALSDDFDDLGRSEGEQSYIALVHADGNGMGKRFEELVLQHDQAKDRGCLDALRELSEAVNSAGQRALEATVQHMLDSFKADASPEMQSFLADLAHADGKPVLPFRPIVFGGDDVTFVCDGRIGLRLAAIYLQQWVLSTQEDPMIGKAYACAGVAIVKAHYPFARAYDLCADLCHAAKHALKQAGRTKTDSAIDWHFALSGIFGSIGDIRAREYRIQAPGWLKPRSLVTRPLICTAGKAGLQEPWRTWPVFADLVATFQDETKYTSRNKVKALREVLRDGPQAVRRFQDAYRLDRLPALLNLVAPDIQAGGWSDQQRKESSELQEGGWNDERCGYFDAIEAIDFFL